MWVGLSGRWTQAGRSDGRFSTSPAAVDLSPIAGAQGGDGRGDDGSGAALRPASVEAVAVVCPPDESSPPRTSAGVPSGDERAVGQVGPLRFVQPAPMGSPDDPLAVEAAVDLLG
jgi:hypothetical protein